MIIPFFRVEGHVVQLSPEIYTIPVYATLAQMHPNEAKKLFSIIYHLYDPGSPYYNKPRETTLEALLNRYEIDRKLVETKEFKEAADEYYNSMKPFEIDVLDSVKNQLNNMKDYMNSNNLMELTDKAGKPIYTPKQITDMISGLDESFTRLQELHEKVMYNMNRSKSKVRGGQKPGMSKNEKTELYNKYASKLVDNVSKDKEES